MPTYKLKFRGRNHGWHKVIAKDAETARKKFVKGTTVNPYDVLLKKEK